MSCVSTDPDFYKKTRAENFNINEDLEDIFRSYEDKVHDLDWGLLRQFIKDLIAKGTSSLKDFEKECIQLRRKARKIYKKSAILHVLRTMQAEGEVGSETPLNRLLITKAGKSTSGVLVITVLTSPYPAVDGKVQKFSCEWNCYYCPNEPGQPRSYLHDEPSVLRANRNRFDPILQFNDRALALAMNGHPVDKIELLILGGTWASYPVGYQEEFIRDLFYAANTFLKRKSLRAKLSLKEEKLLNESANCKIIGITLETRPDCINAEEIRRFRRFGCTRVQLGVQHTDNRILNKINRGCTTEDTVRAIRLLKDSCYKIDIHLMPNLPGSNPQLDKKMFNEVLYNPGLQVDQWKIYPCEVVPWTVIQKWYQKKEYIPYGEDELSDVLIDAKSKVHPWIRLNRVVRDIPSQYIVGGVNRPSLRQDVLKQMKSMGLSCRCIRCREIKDKNLAQEAHLKVRKYEASGGIEYFISFETEDEKFIFGFARLRIPPSRKSPQFERTETRSVNGKVAGRIEQRKTRKRARSKSPMTMKKLNPMTYAVPFPELNGAALVRELHVYGKLAPTVDGKSTNTQHIGFGRRLMKKCEEIAAKHDGINKVAVISGVGVRNFYRKIGYRLEGEGEMMIKDIKQSLYSIILYTILCMTISISVIMQLYLMYKAV